MGEGRQRVNSCRYSRLAWNGSWNEGAESPGVLGAVVALSCVIRGGSGLKASSHASRKRQVSGSNPLTGSASVLAKMRCYLR
jgi:hypothetical protein